MIDESPKVEFEPVEVRPRSEWCVRATLPSGKQCTLGGFTSLADAREWIARKSAAWLKLKQCESARELDKAHGR